MLILKCGHRMRGKLGPLRAALAILVPASLLATPIAAQRAPSRPASEDVRPEPLQTRPLPEIIARVQATPPYNNMDYIGVAGFETRQMIYVLRFINGRQVVVVHVDARSGRILGSRP